MLDIMYKTNSAFFCVPIQASGTTVAVAATAVAMYRLVPVLATASNRFVKQQRAFIF